MEFVCQKLRAFFLETFAPCKQALIWSNNLVMKWSQKQKSWVWAWGRGSLLILLMKALSLHIRLDSLRTKHISITLGMEPNPERTANPMPAICPTLKKKNHWLFFLHYVPFLELRLCLNCLFTEKNERLRENLGFCNQPSLRTKTRPQDWTKKTHRCRFMFSGEVDVLATNFTQTWSHSWWGFLNGAWQVLETYESDPWGIQRDQDINRDWPHEAKVTVGTRFCNREQTEFEG